MTIADTVNTWFAERIACGAIARDTEAYNQALAAKNDLIALLDPTPEPAPEPAPEAETSSADPSA